MVSNHGFAQFQGGKKFLVSIIACSGLVVHVPQPCSTLSLSTQVVTMDNSNTLLGVVQNYFSCSYSSNDSQNYTAKMQEQN